MYNFSRIFNCNFDGFDSLFYQSEPIIDDYVWQTFDLVNATYAERLSYMRDFSNKMLKSQGVLGVYVMDQEGLPLKCDIGAFKLIESKNYLYTNLTFNGVSSEGSRSWLHSPVYIEEAMNFYKTLKVEGRVFPLKKDTAMYKHLSGYSTDKFYYTEEPLEGDDVILYLHYS